MYSIGLLSFLLCAVGLARAATPSDPVLAGTPSGGALSVKDERFLEDLERRAVLYYLDHTDAETGLTQDRAPALGTAGYAPASVAASGFALTAWCIAGERGWMTRAVVKERVTRTLDFVLNHVEHVNGWLYHFVDMQTGKRVWRCEASTIDTALFLKGVITARQFLDDPEVTRLANALYERIDWNWAKNGGATLSHGWTPEAGFIPYRWDSYAEAMGLYLLGIGASRNPLEADTWSAWNRGKRVSYRHFNYFPNPPLFTHQYAQAWFDFRRKHDAFASYWENSVSATLAQRAWCASLGDVFSYWSENLWGLSASDSAEGYRAWGGPIEPGSQRIDGTLVPCAPGGSLPFAPRECLDALLAMRDLNLEGLWGRYGFADAFNPQTGWVSNDVIAIDCGITLIMAENLRTGAVWKWFMAAPETQRAFALTGFKDERKETLVGTN